MVAPSGYFQAVNGTPLTPQFAKIAILGQTTEANGTTKPMNIITHWRAPIASLPGQEAALGAAFKANFDTPLGTLFTGDCTINNYAVKFLDNALNPDVLTVAGVTGGVAGDRGPSFNSVVVRKRTGVPSRNYRGSMHHGAVPETFTTLDDLSSAGNTAYTAYVAIWATMIASGLNDGAALWYPIVLSPTLSTLTSAPPVMWGAWVNEFFLNLRIGTMKRRKEKS